MHLHNYHSCGFWLTDNEGTLRHMLGDSLYFEYTPLDRHNEIHQIPYVKQWASLPHEYSLILTYDGKVTTNSVLKIDRAVLKKIPSFRNSVSFALRADGTVIGPKALPELKEWKDIVDIYCHHDIHETIYYGINAKGDILSSKVGIIPNEKPLFASADTMISERLSTLNKLLDEKKAALQKAKGIFSGKTREDLNQSIAYLEKQIAELQA